MSSDKICRIENEILRKLIIFFRFGMLIHRYLNAAPNNQNYFLCRINNFL